MPYFINGTAFCCHSPILTPLFNAASFQLNDPSRPRHRFLLSLYTKDIIFRCHFEKTAPENDAASTGIFPVSVFLPGLAPALPEPAFLFPAATGYNPCSPPAAACPLFHSQACSISE